MAASRVVAITGAYGYVGSRIRARLDVEGWETHALVRRPHPKDRASPWALGQPIPGELAGRIDALVHCAYDFGPRSRKAVWRANVEGSEILLDSAARSNSTRLLVISSMSAYDGTRQTYGQAKLAVEDVTLRLGGIAVRPGLVYGAHPGGVMGAILKLAGLHVLPLPGAGCLQYPVYDEDVARVVASLVGGADWRPGIVAVAQPEPARFDHVVKHLLRRQRRSAVIVPIPWRPVYALLRLVESAGLRLPVRADSLLGLVYSAPAVPVSAAAPHILDDLERI